MDTWAYVDTVEDYLQVKSKENPFESFHNFLSNVKFDGGQVLYLQSVSMVTVSNFPCNDKFHSIT